MKIKKCRRPSILYYICLLFFIIAILIPFAWGFIVSITPEYEMFKNTKKFLPTTIIFDNYKSLLDFSSRDSKIFFNGISNSLKTSIITILLTLPLASFFAYAISKVPFRGKRFIKFILFSTMAIPVLATIIPLYKIFASLRVLDNFFFLSLVYVTSFLPMNTWIMSNFFDTIPKEIEDAAFIDGCSNLYTFFRIILPLSLPSIFASLLLIFLMTWSQFQIPLILASSYETKPISIVVSEFVSKDSIKYGITTAAGLLAVVPAIFISIFFHRFLMHGLSSTSKGK